MKLGVPFLQFPLLFDAVLPMVDAQARRAERLALRTFQT